MNLWSVHARSTVHGGARWFHVIAYTQVEANRLAQEHAPNAGERTLKAVRDDLPLEQHRRLYEGALNWADWQSDLHDFELLKEEWDQERGDSP